MSIPDGNMPPTIEDAQTALKEKRFQDAIQMARDLTARDSTNYDAWQTLGVACAQNGQPEEAANAFTQCVRQRPNLPQPHFNLAQAFLAVGNTPKAREELGICLQLDPAYTRAAQALRQLGDAPGEGGSGVPGIGSAPGIGGPTLVQAGFGPPAPGQPAPPGSFAPPPGPMIGQPPPAYGQQPASVGQAPIFTPGVPGLAGGQMPPTPTLSGSAYQAGFAGSQRQSGPLELPGGVRAWVISGIVLGGIIALFTFLGIVMVKVMSTLPGMGALSQAAGGVGQLLAVATALVALGFVIGGAGVLGRHEWGRVMVQACCVLAILLIIGSEVHRQMTASSAAAAFQHALATMPPGGVHPAGTMGAPGTMGMPGTMGTPGAMGTPQATFTPNTAAVAGFAGAVNIFHYLLLLLELAWCIKLFLVLNPEEVKAVTRGN